MKILSKNNEYTFDNILLLPNYVNFPVKEEKQNISLKTRISRNVYLDVPIVSSPMPTVTEEHMARTIGLMGGMGFIHPFQSYQEQLNQVAQVKKDKIKVAASIMNLDEKDLKHCSNLIKLSIDLISIETLQTHDKSVIAFIKKFKNRFPKTDLSVGVSVTPEAVTDLIRAGADSIRIGIGGGSHCTTRLVTGVGRPQISAIQDCVKITRKYNIPLISDSGIKYSGDIPKALIFGADAVMIGGLFAGTDESPGKIISIEEKKYKYSWGMCSKKAISSNTIPQRSLKVKIITSLHSLFEDDHRNNISSNIIEEGIEGMVPYRGSVRNILQQLIDGTRRSMWYQGSRNINELRKKAKVIFVTSETILENTPRL